MQHVARVLIAYRLFRVYIQRINQEEDNLKTYSCGLNKTVIVFAGMCNFTLILMYFTCMRGTGVHSTLRKFETLNVRTLEFPQP